MTNKEYLIASLNGLNVSDSDIAIIMAKSGVDGESPVNVRECDMAVYNRMSVVLKSCMANVSEGGYSVSWNMEAVKAFYKALAAELGKPDVLFTKPKIRNRSNLW